MLAPLLLLLTAGPQPTLAVMEFQVAGASGELAGAVEAVCGNELERLGVFKVTTASTTKTLLGLERMKQLMGCTESCGTDDGQPLVFDLVVTGKVTKAAGSYTLELSLIDTKVSKRVSSELITSPNESGLVEQLRAALLKLVGKQLAGRQGGLVVLSSEHGASVKVDGSIIGTTPLPGRATLAAGPHLVEVDKQGYVKSEREVRIAPDEVTENVVTLVPSPDTINAYQSFNTKLRVGAWVTTALAVGGVGLFAGEQLNAGDLYGPFQTEKKALQGGDETVRNKATMLKTQITTAETVSFIGLGVGLAAAATAVVLWVIGEDPARYDRYRELKVALGSSTGDGFAFTFR
jgi:hypothetical protein